MDMLDGMFSFVLLDTRDNSFIVARDAIGITSLYIGWGLDGNVSKRFWFMSTVMVIDRYIYVLFCAQFRIELNLMLVTSILSSYYAIFSGSIWISSELKGLNDDCEHFECFPPGHLYSSKLGGLKQWYNPLWFSEAIPSTPYDPLVLRHAFENVRNANSSCPRGFEIFVCKI